MVNNYRSCLCSKLVFHCSISCTFPDCFLSWFLEFLVFSLGTCPFQSNDMNCFDWLSCFCFCCSGQSCLFICLKFSSQLRTFCRHDMEYLDSFVIGPTFFCPSSSLLFTLFNGICCWCLPCTLLLYLYWMNFIAFLNRPFLFLIHVNLLSVLCNQLNCFCSISLVHGLKCCLLPEFLNCSLKVNGFMTLAHLFDSKVFSSMRILNCTCWDLRQPLDSWLKRFHYALNFGLNSLF